MLAGNKKTKCQIVIIIIIRPVFIMLCAVREPGARSRRFVPCKFAYFVAFDISVTRMHTHSVPYRTVFGICSHSLSPFPPFPSHSVIHCIPFSHAMRSCNPHNNNPAAMNPTLYARMPGIILCDACLPFCNHYYCTANTTSTHTHNSIHNLQHFFPFQNFIIRSKTIH